MYPNKKEHFDFISLEEWVRHRCSSCFYELEGILLDLCTQIIQERGNTWDVWDAIKKECEDAEDKWFDALQAELRACRDKDGA